MSSTVAKPPGGFTLGELILFAIAIWSVGLAIALSEGL